MEIYYEKQGSGYPILLLHGNQETHAIFKKSVESLKDQYTCISIDSRYHGKSIKSGELSLHQMARDVMSVADELGLEAYDVIGFSDGANIGLTLASLDPRMKHLVSIGANSHPKGMKVQYYYMIYMVMICLLPFCLYNKKCRLQYKLYKFMLKEPEFTKDYLESIKIPVLVLAGEDDMIRESDTRFISDHLEYSVLKIIKNGNHFILEEMFTNTMKEIRMFLDACHKGE